MSAAAAVVPVVRERPILFSGEMVRAILEGRKTQTRRVANLPATFKDKSGVYPLPEALWVATVIGGHGTFRITRSGRETVSQEAALWNPKGATCIACPHGTSGDRLWVRETFKVNEPPSGWIYRATDEKSLVRDEDRPWKPAIHMPRAAARITLEIVSVRVERLQDISADDAVAEGVRYMVHPNADNPKLVNPMINISERPCVLNYLPKEKEAEWTHEMLLRAHFARLWDSINESRGFGWAVNPWTWVIEFKRVTP